MFHILYSIILILSFSSITAFAQSEHPIDAWTDSCLGQDPSTVGMLGCLEQAYEQWDRELNTVYQQLQQQVNEPAKAALKASQRAWLTYRDAEFTTIDTIYGSLEGTMWLVAGASTKVEFVKRRTLELQSYIDSLLTSSRQ